MTDDVKLPPHNEDAERNVLGSIMLNNDVLLEVQPICEPAHFYRESHRCIARAIWSLSEDGEPVDVTTVLARLDTMGQVERAGQNAVVRLANDVPSSANAASYAKIVRELHDRRRMIRVCESTTSRLYGSADEYDSECASDDVMAVAQAVRAGRTAETDYSIKAHLREEFNRIERLTRGEGMPHFKTGIPAIDDNEDFVDNFTDSKIIGIAAKPKMGKSKLANRISGHWVQNHGFACDQWYCDGRGSHWGVDNISRLANVDSRKLTRRPGTMSEAEWSRVTKFFGEVSHWDVTNYNIGSPHIRDIVLTTKKRLADLNGEKPLVLVVDYMQKVQADADSDEGVKRKVIEELCALRTDNKNLVILMLAQFNRGSNQQAMPRPDQLKGSSAIEQGLDSLYIWHRPKLYDVDAEPDEKNKGLLWLALTKFTSPGVAKLYADMSTSQFEKFSDRGGYQY